MRCKRTVDRSLTAQLLQHLGGTGQSITRLADGNVQDELLDAELPHGVLGLVGLQKSCQLNSQHEPFSNLQHTMMAVVVSKGSRLRRSVMMDWRSDGRGVGNVKLARFSSYF